MFRKIVSNLPFSPALVGQLGFYAKRLKNEEITRRLGLVFIVLALIVQSLAVFQPSESANASSSNDMVTGGISSVSDYLAAYDSNTKNIKDVMNYVGITREEIASIKYEELKVGSRLSWGFTPHFSYDQGERQYNITNSDGQQVTTAYSRPLNLWGDYYVKGWTGYSKAIGWFGIMRACGNLVTEKVPAVPTVVVKTPEPVVSTPVATTPVVETPVAEPKCAVNPLILASDSNCKPCPGNETIWINDSTCKPNIIKSKIATNASQGFVEASTVTANAGDHISYTLVVENTGLSSDVVSLQDSLVDLLEYSVLIDNGGGTFNKETSTLSWQDVTLSPKDKQTRTFTVKMLETIPSTAQGSSNLNSYDCIATNTFGNSINIKIACPTAKVVEQVATELPTTGPSENMIFMGIILAIATYFYARTKQVKKEIRLIRRDTSAGTI